MRSKISIQAATISSRIYCYWKKVNADKESEGEKSHRKLPTSDMVTQSTSRRQVAWHVVICWRHDLSRLTAQTESSQLRAKCYVNTILITVSLQCVIWELSSRLKASQSLAPYEIEILKDSFWDLGTSYFSCFNDNMILAQKRSRTNPQKYNTVLCGLTSMLCVFLLNL